MLCAMPVCVCVQTYQGLCSARSSGSSHSKPQRHPSPPPGGDRQSGLYNTSRISRKAPEPSPSLKWLCCSNAAAAAFAAGVSSCRGSSHLDSRVTLCHQYDLPSAVLASVHPSCSILTYLNTISLLSVTAPERPGPTNKPNLIHHFL